MTEAEAVEKSKEIVNMLKFWENHGWISSIKIEKVREYFIALTISLNLIQTQQAEIEKKDKITDKMAEWIEKHTKYYDEDGCYCEVEKDICNKTIDCKDCIKQYFERKVENGN